MKTFAVGTLCLVLLFAMIPFDLAKLGLEKLLWGGDVP
jgi:hypothetical protein